MVATTNSSAHPLIARLRQIAEAEQTRREAADRALAEAERQLQDAQHAQHVAAERYAAVLATVEAAETYATGLSNDTSDARNSSAQEENSPEEAQDASLTQLVLDSFEPRGDTPLSLLYKRVLNTRPSATESGVRAKLSTLHKAGVVTIVRRGVYRMSNNPGGRTTEA
ncbi:hypothetical protein [Streptomyces niveus]|uniref:hypothetical protein n=1 Tax=Streptomyces niveus TaxID=193462 RepID=UPI003678D662